MLKFRSMSVSVIVFIVLLFGCAIPSMAQTPVATSGGNSQSTTPTPLTEEELEACICDAFMAFKNASGGNASCSDKAAAAKTLANAVRSCLSAADKANFNKKITCPGGTI